MTCRVEIEQSGSRDDVELRTGDGEEVLRFYDMGDVDVAADFGVLIGFAVFFQLCFAVVLYYFHTGRR